jgi:hypothetical protein
MAMKLYHYRFDETTIQRLHEIHLAKAHAAGAQVAYGTYAARHNGLTQVEVIRSLIDEEWQRLNDSGALTRARVKRCPNCGRTSCPGGYWCEG